MYKVILQVELLMLKKNASHRVSSQAKVNKEQTFDRTLWRVKERARMLRKNPFTQLRSLKASGNRY